MNKLLFSVIILFLNCYCTLFSQELVLTNGITFSNAGEGFKSSPKTYQVDFCVNYLVDKWYFLSSGVGYTQKGGDFYEDSQKGFHKFRNKYLTFNTLCNIQKRFDSSNIYLGIGPRVDVKLSDGAISYNPVNKFLFGLKCMAGYNYYFSDFLVGINFCYYPTLTKFYKEINQRDKTFSLGVSIGYVL